MKKLLTLVIALFPLLVFGQAVSRTELRNTNNILLSTITNQLRWSDGAVIDPPRTGLLFFDSSFGDPTGCLFACTYPAILTNRYPWSHMYSSNNSISGKGLTAATNRYYSNILAVITNWVNAGVRTIVLSDATSVNDGIVGSEGWWTNDTKYITAKSNWYASFKALGVAMGFRGRVMVGTIPQNATTLADDFETPMAAYSRVKYLYRNWARTCTYSNTFGTPLVDHIAEFALKLPDCTQTNKWDENRVHPNYNGELDMTDAWVEGALIGGNRFPITTYREGTNVLTRSLTGTLIDKLGDAGDHAQLKAGYLTGSSTTSRARIIAHAQNGTDGAIEGYAASGASTAPFTDILFGLYKANGDALFKVYSGGSMEGLGWWYNAGPFSLRGAQEWTFHPELDSVLGGPLYLSNTTTKVLAATIASNGYWGFGTNAPEARLHVNGTVQFDNVGTNGSPDYFLAVKDGKVVNTATPSGVGSGDFVGPASSTDTAIVVYDGTTGKLGKNSGVLIEADSDIVSPAAMFLNVMYAHSGYYAYSSGGGGRGGWISALDGQFTLSSFNGVDMSLLFSGTTAAFPSLSRTNGDLVLSGGTRNLVNPTNGLRLHHVMSVDGSSARDGYGNPYVTNSTGIDGGSGYTGSENVITNPVVAASVNENSSIISSNSNGSANNFWLHKHGALFSWQIGGSSNVYEINGEVGTSSPTFVHLERENRSITFGEPGTGASINTITNRADVYNESNTVTSGGSQAASFTSVGAGSGFLSMTQAGTGFNLSIMPTNLVADTRIWLEPITSLTNDFVLNALNTNRSSRAAFVCATIAFTNVLAGDVSAVGLYVDQDGDGVWEKTGIGARLNGVALSAGEEEVSAMIMPWGRFLLTNLSAGITPSATIKANSSQVIRP